MLPCGIHLYSIVLILFYLKVSQLKDVQAFHEPPTRFDQSQQPYLVTDLKLFPTNEIDFDSTDTSGHYNYPFRFKRVAIFLYESKHLSYKIQRQRKARTSIYLNIDLRTMLVRDVIPATMEYVLPAFFSSYRARRKAPGNLHSSPSKCANIQLPTFTSSSNPPSTTGGRPADFLLYITTDQQHCQSSGVELSTVLCYADRYYDQPLSAIINMCESSWKKTGPYDDLVGSLTRSFSHELIHSSGFSTDSFPFYRTKDLKARVNRDKFTGLPPLATDKWKAPFTYEPSPGVITFVGHDAWITTPTVKKTVSEHFGFDYMGAALVSGSNEGQAYSHLLPLHFNDDLMQPRSSKSSTRIVSKVVLSVLADSGWYSVDMDYGSSTVWGDGRFSNTEEWVKKGCYTPAKSGEFPNSLSPDLFRVPQSPEEGSAIPSCSWDTRYLAQTTIKSHTHPIPTKFQYYGPDHPTWGGPAYNNFCALADHFLIEGGNSNCWSGNNMRKYWMTRGSLFGQNSKCLASTLTNPGQSFTQPNYGTATCYKINCDLSDATVTIHVQIDNVKSESVVCKSNEEGVLKNVPGKDGSITCPNVKRICYQFPCLNGGAWAHQRCFCQPGFLGESCEYSDTGLVRNFVPAHYHYGDMRKVTLLSSHAYYIPAHLKGPSNLEFSIIGPKLPGGLNLDARTGAIYGKPVEVTNKCTVYTFRVKNIPRKYATEITTYFSPVTRGSIRLRVVTAGHTNSLSQEAEACPFIPLSVPSTDLKALEKAGVNLGPIRETFFDMFTVIEKSNKITNKVFGQFYPGDMAAKSTYINLGNEVNYEQHQLDMYSENSGGPRHRLFFICILSVFSHLISYSLGI